MPAELGGGLIPVTTVRTEVRELFGATVVITRVFSRNMIVKRPRPSERSGAQFALKPVKY